jgi:very-long-chain (3R)-3-hydroxyacyl-CoA dehydratase
MRASQLYLACYNAGQALAWSAVLYSTCSAVRSGSAVFPSCGGLVTVAQLLTALETLHALAGLVRSGVAANALQFAGRTHCWLLVRRLPELQTSAALAVLVLAWSCADVVRYSWAAAGCIGKTPQVLTWLRYTAFILLYPLGAGAEMALMFQAVPAAGAGLRRVSLPNTLNASFDYRLFLLTTLLLYPLLFLQLYTHMLGQRRKKLLKNE